MSSPSRSSTIDRILNHIQEAVKVASGGDAINDERHITAGASERARKELWLAAQAIRNRCEPAMYEFADRLDALRTELVHHQCHAKFNATLVAGTSRILHDLRDRRDGTTGT